MGTEHTPGPAERLHDMISDMIESGRLDRGMIPNDYDALVELLAGPCQAGGTDSGGKHTPGPWNYDCYGDGSSGIVPTEGYMICVMADKAHDPATVAANARLIAAAPDMLAALSDLVIGASENGYNGLSLSRARAAIDKVKGE